MYLYLILNIGSFIIPFLYSFEKRMNYIKNWKPVFLSIFLVAIPFLIWDVIFTKQGVWGFNSDYHLGIELKGLPFEEVLFFFCIPYASIFTHYAFFYFFPKLKIPKKLTDIITFVLLFIALMLVLNNTSKAYTLTVFLVFSLLLIYSILSKKKYLQQFYISFVLILIPFFLVNGVLTGSFIENEVVWYNNSENLGIRLGTIPVEDIFYAFSMLFPAVVLIEKFKPIFSDEN